MKEFRLKIKITKNKCARCIKETKSFFRNKVNLKVKKCTLAYASYI